MRYLCAALGVSFLVGCVNEIEVQNKLYFDLEGFLRGEVYRLGALDTCVTKMVSIGDSAQVRTIEPADSIFWKKELTLFTEADINAPAYRGLYTVTRTKEYDDSVITFTATVSKTPTRLLKVWKYRGQPKRIEAERETRNVVYFTRHHLVYDLEHGCRIESIQKTKGAPQRHFVIDVGIGCTPFVDFQF